jgi:inner membrane protein
MEDVKNATAWLTRPVWGLATIGILVLLLAVPIGLIRSLIGQRITTRGEAVTEVTRIWGGEQSLIGPKLVIPVEGSEGGPRRAVTLLPATLSVDGDLRTEELRRGLFAVPVYSARVSLRGSFEAGDLTDVISAEEDLRWDEATLVMEVSHVKSLGGASTLTWNGQPVTLRPGTTGQGGGVHASVALRNVGANEFAFALDVNGAEAIWFVPLGRTTDVTLESNWPHPSFAGAWLPSTREVRRQGFGATWVVPSLGREYPHAWQGSGAPDAEIAASRFGVLLKTPVDYYRMSERSTKYAVLVLVMVFGLLWLFDTLVGVRLHIVQYVLVGAAMCLFYLLELSLSEVVGFAGAYACAAAAVAGLIAAYTMAVLGSATRGAIVGGALGVLYSYLFALLTLERYALLAGSLGLFAALAAVMYVTRGVNWEHVGVPSGGAAG